MDFSNAYVNGMPLVLVVIGLVEWGKQLGLSGIWLKVLSMVIGILLGMLYQISLEIPADFAGWFGAAVYGLALGLVASGIYDAAKSALRVEK